MSFNKGHIQNIMHCKGHVVVWVLTAILTSSFAALFVYHILKLEESRIAYLENNPRSLGAATINLSASDSLSTALRNAKGGDTIILKDGVSYKFANEVNTMRYGSPVTIMSETPRGAILDCITVCYMSGAKNVIFKELHIKGRINTDGLATPGDSNGIQFIDNYWESGNHGFTESLKGSHQSHMTVRGNVFIKNGTGARDRLLDWVNVDDSIVENNTFVNQSLPGNTGAIQIKGGSERNIVRENYVLWGGQRAIQIGGSTCWDDIAQSGCWGKNADGSEIHPRTVGWEAIDTELYDNIIVANASCLSFSTQKGTNAHHNTCYMPVSTGGVYFMRLMQEVESDMLNYIEPSQYASITNNLFLYPVTKTPSGGGINSQLVNFSDTGNTSDSWLVRTRQLIDTFTFDKNAYYAITPITNDGFGRQNPPIYPHRHIVGNLPYNPWAWKSGWVDQVSPGITDWGLPTMRPTTGTYTSGSKIGARINGSNNPVGADWWTIPSNLLPGNPPEVSDYSVGTLLYGWIGPGSEEVLELPVPPVVTLTALPVSVMSGQGVTLTWVVVGNATSCTASGGWSGSKSVSGGSEARNNITASQTYTISCSNAGGSRSASVSVAVAIPPLPPVVDTTPPVISNINVTNITQTGATIRWSTNEAATSQVAYGITNALGATTQKSNSLVSNHDVAVTGLTPGTQYYYRVVSLDERENVRNSNISTFTTASSPGGSGNTTNVVIKIDKVNRITSGVYAVFNTGGDELSRGNFVTDDQGVTEIILPAGTPTNVQIRIKPTGFLSTTASISKNDNKTFIFAPKIGDFDGDGRIDALDAQAFIDRWKDNNINSGDFNGDGVVNALDYSVFLTNWDERDE